VRWTRFASSMLAVLGFVAPPAAAQLVVDEIAVVANLVGSGPQWFFFTEVLGTGLTAGSVLPPIGGSITLIDEEGDGTELGFEAGPFASWSDLLSAYPAGDYAFTINGTETVTLAWSPTEPVGAGGPPSLTIDSPSDGAAGVDTMPDVAFTLDCANCNDLNLELEERSQPGATFNFGELDVGGFTNPIPFGVMQSSGGETELALGLTDAALLAGLANFFENSTFDLPTTLAPFEYIEAAVVSAVSTFTVPEPGRRVTSMAALGMLGLLARAAFRRDQRNAPSA